MPSFAPVTPRSEAMSASPPPSMIHRHWYFKSIMADTNQSSKRLTSKYYVPIKPNRSTKHKPNFHTIQERPLVAPVHDPENSTLHPEVSQIQDIKRPATQVWSPLQQDSILALRLQEERHKPAVQRSVKEICQGKPLPSTPSDRSYLSIDHPDPKAKAKKKPLDNVYARELAYAQSHGPRRYSSLFDTHGQLSDSSEKWTRFPEYGAPRHPSMMYVAPPPFDSPPPDGGTMAWLHVLAGFLITFNAQ